MERCFRMLRHNEGLDLQKLIQTRPGQRLMDGLLDWMDLTVLRSREPEYVRIVFSLLMAALGSAFMDTLLQPENRKIHREELALRIEIIQNGCLSAKG